MSREKHRIFLIKPVSGECNLSCFYCFYSDEVKNRKEKSYGMMTTVTAHNLIDKAYSDDEFPSFVFQGGEPTLRGLDFFKDFTTYAKEKGKCAFAIQTNGYVLDDQWAVFLRDNNYLVGLSLDGNKKLHDRFRITKKGEGSYKKVYRAFQILKKYNVEFNVVSVVTNESVKRESDIIRFSEANDIRYLQFIPCIDPLREERGESTFSLSPTDYGSFLNNLFDWYYSSWKKGNYFSIRYFDNLVIMAMGGRPESCGMSGRCSLQYVIEADGSVFPCDFYVLDDYKLGNINNDSFDVIDESRMKIKFIEKSEVIESECIKCSYFGLCRGGCRRDREDFSRGELNKTYLCEAYKIFFDHSALSIIEMAEAERRRRKKR